MYPGPHLLALPVLPGLPPLAPGHDIDLFDPRYRAANLTGAAIASTAIVRTGDRGRNQNQNQNNNNQAGAPSAMLNGANCCYGGASFLMVAPGMEVTLVPHYNLILLVFCRWTYT